MNAERANAVALLVIFLSVFIFQPSGFSDLLASDNADNDPYPLGWNPGDNAGVGFAGWVVLESGTPGSMYVENLSELEGNYSWGESGTYALGRGLSNSLAEGRWIFLARHDFDNTGFSGFNLRSSTNIGSGFDSSELLRFGMDPGIPDYDNTGVYISTNGGSDYVFLGLGGLDVRNATLQYSVEWHSAGTYSLTVSNVTAGGFATLTGNMSAGSDVAMLGMGIFGANTGETLTFDAFSVAVPEPSAFAVVILGGLLLFGGRRRAR